VTGAGRSLSGRPRGEPTQWLLSVDGAVRNPCVGDWEALRRLAPAAWRGDIHGVTRWWKFDMGWRGVSVHALIERAEPTPAASPLMAHSYGGYTTNLPLNDVLAYPALIAYEIDGQPLAPDHGGPARLLVPHLYLWKSAKWIRRLELLEHDELGFWETNGYHHRGDPWREERHSVDAYVARTLRRRARGTRDPD